MARTKPDEPWRLNRISFSCLDTNADPGPTSISCGINTHTAGLDVRRWNQRAITLMYETMTFICGFVDPLAVLHQKLVDEAVRLRPRGQLRPPRRREAFYMLSSNQRDLVFNGAEHAGLACIHFLRRVEEGMPGHWVVIARARELDTWEEVLLQGVDFVKDCSHRI